MILVPRGIELVVLLHGNLCRHHGLTKTVLSTLDAVSSLLYSPLPFPATNITSLGYLEMGNFKKKKKKRELVACHEVLFHTIQNDATVCDVVASTLQSDNYTECVTLIWAKYGKDILGD